MIVMSINVAGGHVCTFDVFIYLLHYQVSESVLFYSDWIGGSIDRQRAYIDLKLITVTCSFFIYIFVCFFFFALKLCTKIEHCLLVRIQYNIVY